MSRNLPNWRELVVQTAQFPNKFAAAYLALGLAGEAGEVANIVKKYIRRYAETNEDGTFYASAKFVWGDPIQDKLMDELGDVLWYVHAILRNQGWSEAEVFEHTSKKLLARVESDTIKATDHSSDPDICLAFKKSGAGNRGTASCVNFAREANIPVFLEVEPVWVHK